VSRLGTLAAAFALVTGLARAQSTAAPTASDSIPAASPPETIAAMKLLLRNLVTAQEKYWYDHGKYAADIAALGAASASPGQAQAEVIAAGSSGWSAVARHPSLKGRTCIVYVGNGQSLAPAADQKLKAASEGTPACDAP
jgi:hypothetical protein